MTIRLTYFNFPFWRAEASRLALHLGGVDFEDVRPNREEFRALKASGALPYGQLPVLEVDGVMIAQSVAITRFCGKLGGFYPSDNVDAARVDELLDTATQITGLFAPSMREPDATKKAEMRQKLATEALPQWLRFLEQRLAANSDPRFFVGESMTVADLALWRLMGWLVGGFLDGIPTDLMATHPTLVSFYDGIDGHEGVRAWMTSHYGAK